MLFLKPLSIKLPEKYLEGLDQLVKAGMYPSVSEAARVAIREFLERELERWVERGRVRRELTFS